MEAAALHERLRLRALARLLSADIVRSLDDSQAQQQRASLSKSTQLTAIAQNGALKLQCDRTFVSLIDASTMYIVAEATRSISLRDPGRMSTPDDALLVGARCLDGRIGMCPKSFDAFTDTTGELVLDTQNAVYNKTRHVVRDLRLQEEYKDLPHVLSFPYLRSYVGVPIKDSNGQVLGSYCAMDTKVRDDFFDDETISTLTEIADCISDHLELQAVKLNHARGERLMQGLAEFTKGRPRRQKKRYERDDVLPTHSSSENVPALDSSSTSTRDDSEVPPVLSDSPSLDQYFCPSSDTTGASTSVTTPLNGPCVETHQVLNGAFAALPSGRPMVKNVFSEAADLIREAMDIEGLVFLDGSHKVHTTEYSSGQAVDVEDMTCEVLGSSLTSGPSSFGPSYTPLVLHGSSWDYLVERHPDGCIYTADEYGILDQSEKFAPVPHKGSRELSHDHDMPVELRDLVSKARSLVFLPLWDHSKESVFVGLVGWSTDPNRVLEQQDITCLSAFGNTFKTEISRSDAVKLSRAKSDFLSSISHELRSPLHGILASTELLEETKVNGPQSDLIDMIHTCGTTLLDTLNHLLDFSKINVFNDAKGHARKSAKTTGQDTTRNPLSQDSDDYLCRLVQDVVEGVHFGHASHQASLSKSKAAPFDVFVGRDTLVDPALLIESGCMADGPPRTEMHDPVGIFLYMQNRDDWYMTLCAGAWKRVVMNLVGNAIKYTDNGHIEVGLKLITDLRDPKRKTVHLMVKDTGIGMSEDYIEHHLYQPFVQENPLANGTGLGLSIVKQIVEDLGGSINVQSTPGLGTCFDVLVPMTALPKTDKHVLGNEMLDPTGELQGITFCLLSDQKTIPTGKPQNGPQQRRTAAMQSAVTAIIQDWFAMKVVHAQSPSEVEADLYLIEQPYLAQILDSGPDGASFFQGKRVICLDPLALSPGVGFTRLSYPIGPRSLYKAIHAAMTTRTEFLLPRAYDGSGRTMCVPCRPEPTRSLETPTVAASRADSGVALPTTSTLKQESDSEQPALLADVGNKPLQQHLLLVDDNAINLRILSSYVKKLGISADTAENGLEAYEKYMASEKPYTTVLMDLSMPVMNGFESSRAIRDYESKNPDHVLKATTIVALTGLGSEASRQEAALSGINEFLTKPVKLKILKELLTVP